MSVRIYLHSGRYVDMPEVTVADIRDAVKRGVASNGTFLCFGTVEEPERAVRIDAIEAVVKL